MYVIVDLDQAPIYPCSEPTMTNAPEPSPQSRDGVGALGSLEGGTPGFRAFRV